MDADNASALLAKLRTLFDGFDANKSGALERDEVTGMYNSFYDGLLAQNYMAIHQRDFYVSKQVENVFNSFAIDKDGGGGKLEFAKFVELTHCCSLWKQLGCQVSHDKSLQVFQMHQKAAALEDAAAAREHWEAAAEADRIVRSSVMEALFEAAVATAAGEDATREDAAAAKAELERAESAECAGPLQEEVEPIDAAADETAAAAAASPSDNRTATVLDEAGNDTAAAVVRSGCTEEDEELTTDLAETETAAVVAEVATVVVSEETAAVVAEAETAAVVAEADFAAVVIQRKLTPHPRLLLAAAAEAKSWAARQNSAVSEVAAAESGEELAVAEGAAAAVFAEEAAAVFAEPAVAASDGEEGVAVVVTDGAVIVVAEPAVAAEGVAVPTDGHQGVVVAEECLAVQLCVAAAPLDKPIKVFLNREGQMKRVKLQAYPADLQAVVELFRDRFGLEKAAAPEGLQISATADGVATQLADVTMLRDGAHVEWC